MIYWASGMFATGFWAVGVFALDGSVEQAVAPPQSFQPTKARPYTVGSGGSNGGASGAGVPFTVQAP